MNDVLTEMQASQEYPPERPDPQAAEMALLRHLALEGELSLRRDQLQAEHQAVSQRLVQARGMRQGLVEAVQAAGGKLPSWESV